MPPFQPKLKILREIISEKMSIPIEKIPFVYSFKDLGIDSMEIVEIAIAIESRFDIVIEDGDHLRIFGKNMDNTIYTASIVITEIEHEKRKKEIH